MTDELASMDATAQAALVRGGEVSPAELFEAAIGRIEALNPELNAVIHPLFAKARDVAKGELGEGPFRGVPMVVKDLGAHTAGDSSHEGTKFAKEAGWTEAHDSELIKSFGHGVEPDAYPPELDDPDLVATFLVRFTSGIAWWLKVWEARLGREIAADDVEACTWALAQLGRSHSGPDFLAAIEKHQLAGRAAARWHEGFDLLLTPTMGEPPTRIGEYAPDPENPAAPILRATPIACFTAGANMTGQPVISLPLYWSDDGLPIGVQLVTPFGREDLLLRVAAQLEEARPWADRRPSRYPSALA